MLIIDFDGKEIDIEGKIYKSLKLLTRAIIGINFINLIEEKHKGTPLLLCNDYTESFEHDLVYGNFTSRNNELKKINLTNDTLFNIIFDSQEDLSSCNFPIHESYDIFEIARTIVINNFSFDYKLEIGSDFDYIDFLSRGLDFISNDLLNICNLIHHLEKIDIKEKQSTITLIMRSFARTISSYIDSLFKEFIGTIFTSSHYFLAKNIIANKYNEKEINDRIDTIIKNTVFGKRFNNIISDLYDLSSENGNILYLKYEKQFDMVDKFIECRNAITHHYNADQECFDYIIENWESCSNFLKEIYQEFNSCESEGEGEGVKYLLSNTTSIILSLSKETETVIKKIIPLYKKPSEIVWFF
ncbi:TPA: hypothetical protein L9857_003580 [Klebsiella pneumoniae]|nr:hypothetical protein [Klebsiella pneumoniae]HBR9701227.1 hypothetical protein [Klebsiella pneumoniae]